MKFSIYTILLIIIVTFVSSCASSKKLKPSIIPADSTAGSTIVIPQNDSLKISYEFLHELKNNQINFQTFSGKAKVQFEDKNGRQPDANAIIRMEKNTKIWISLSAAFLNIEVVRILITPDSLILINKLEKTVEVHPYRFIQEVVQLPLSFSMLQDIIIGNPIFVGDSVINSAILGNNILIKTGNNSLNNSLAISRQSHLLSSSKITNIFNGDVRIASMEYGDYNADGQLQFATYRSLNVESPSKIDLRMSFKEFEFNNELSFPFSIPGNYKIK